MQKGDEASPSIILAGRALLVKMLINLEPHGIFGSDFFILMYTHGKKVREHLLCYDGKLLNIIFLLSKYVLTK